jgi:O-antigen/teichoic acid export membrane protein
VSAQSFRRLVRVNGLVVITLAVGFAVTIVVPRFAIARLGVDAFGVYALIAGFAGIFAFADMGLIPGITRALAMPIARGQGRAVGCVLKRAVRTTFLGWIFLSIVSLALLIIADPLLSIDHAFALLFFILASAVTTYGELHAAVLRVSGKVTATYLLRTMYLLVYATLVVASYVAIRAWPGIWLLCFLQLIASLPCAIFLTRIAKRQIGRLGGGDSEGTDAERSWSEAWRVSSPERLTKVLSLAASVMERPLLLAMNGPIFVASYDLLNRTALIVSAVPGALSQPLMAMLAHDEARHKEHRRFGGAYNFARLAGFLTAGLGLVVSVVIWTRFHVQVFGVPSALPLGFGLLILISSALNVLTAPGVALCLSSGKTRLVHAKLLIELAGMISGLAVALYLRSATAVIVGRYTAIAAGALLFWLNAPRPTTESGP